MNLGVGHHSRSDHGKGTSNNLLVQCATPRVIVSPVGRRPVLVRSAKVVVACAKARCLWLTETAGCKNNVTKGGMDAAKCLFPIHNAESIGQHDRRCSVHTAVNGCPAPVITMEVPQVQVSRNSRKMGGLA